MVCLQYEAIAEEIDQTGFGKSALWAVEGYLNGMTPGLSGSAKTTDGKGLGSRGRHIVANPSYRDECRRMHDMNSTHRTAPAKSNGFEEASFINYDAILPDANTIASVSDAADAEDRVRTSAPAWFDRQTSGARSTNRQRLSYAAAAEKELHEKRNSLLSQKALQPKVILVGGGGQSRTALVRIQIAALLLAALGILILDYIAVDSLVREYTGGSNWRAVISLAGPVMVGLVSLKVFAYLRFKRMDADSERYRRHLALALLIGVPVGLFATAFRMSMLTADPLEDVLSEAGGSSSMGLSIAVFLLQLAANCVSGAACLMVAEKIHDETREPSARLNAAHVFVEQEIAKVDAELMLVQEQLVKLRGEHEMLESALGGFVDRSLGALKREQLKTELIQGKLKAMQ